MEFLQRAKVFRLKCSHQSKYLIADQDEETVKLSRESSSPYVRWSYELAEGKTNVIRLRSCHSWKYLAASEEHFLLGMTGKRLAQRPYLGATVEWEPIKEGPYIKLKSHCGTFLRGNKGPPPWRNTITHDVSGHWTASQSMTLWIVDIIEIDRKSTNVGDSKSNGGAATLSSNVVDQKFFSSNSSLSNDGDGSAEIVSSLEEAEFDKDVAKAYVPCNINGTLVREKCGKCYGNNVTDEVNNEGIEKVLKQLKANISRPALSL